MKSHDERYKFLFGQRAAIESLVRVYAEKLGIPREVVERLDFRNMRQDSGESSTPGLGRRQADMVWVIPFVGGGPGEELVLMLEFQSKVEPAMLSRAARYVHLQLWEREENKKFKPGQVVPTMVLAVLHNGREHWNVPTDSAQMSATRGRPGDMPVLEGRSHYRLLDIQTLDTDDLPQDDPIAWLVRIEQAAAGPESEEVLVEALRALRGKVSEEMEEALYEFAAVPDKHTEGKKFITLPDARDMARRLDNVEEDDMSMTLKEWNTARYFADIENQALDRGREEGREEGLEQGREQGLEQGREEVLAEERALLRDLAATRFDEATAARLTEPLERIHDPARLREVGRWIISCETGDELLSRTLRLNGSG